MRIVLGQRHGIGGFARIGAAAAGMGTRGGVPGRVAFRVRRNICQGNYFTGNCLGLPATAALNFQAATCRASALIVQETAPRQIGSSYESDRNRECSCGMNTRSNGSRQTMTTTTPASATARLGRRPLLRRTGAPSHAARDLARTLRDIPKRSSAAWPASRPHWATHCSRATAASSLINAAGAAALAEAAQMEMAACSLAAEAPAGVR